MKWTRSTKMAVVAGLLLFCSNWTSGQQAAPIAENAAADQIAIQVQQVRQQSGLPKLRRIHDARLRAQACDRAEHGDESITITTGFFREKVGTTSCLLYSTSDPQRASPKLIEWAEEKTESERDWTARRLAVGVCFRRTAEHPEGRYWVCAAKYLSAIKSFFYGFVWD